MKKATITYRLDRNGRAKQGGSSTAADSVIPLQDGEYEVVSEPPARSRTTDGAGAGQRTGTFDAETLRVERLIRATDDHRAQRSGDDGRSIGMRSGPERHREADGRHEERDAGREAWPDDAARDDAARSAAESRRSSHAYGGPTLERDDLSDRHYHPDSRGERRTYATDREPDRGPNAQARDQRRTQAADAVSERAHYAEARDQRRTQAADAVSERAHYAEARDERRTYAPDTVPGRRPNADAPDQRRTYAPDTVPGRRPNADARDERRTYAPDTVPERLPDASVVSTRPQVRRFDAINPVYDSYDAETGYYDSRAYDTAAGGAGFGDESHKHIRYSRHTRPNWLKIVTSVSGAVATGALLGFFVLQMMSGEKDAGRPADTAGGLPAAEQKAKDQAAAPAAAGGTDAARPAAVQIVRQSYAVLQAGVFSTEQSALAAQTDLQNKGLAAIVEQGDKYNVYVGIAGGRDEAKKLAEQLTTLGMPLYAKLYELPAVSQLTWNGKPEAAQTYFSASAGIARTMAGLSALQLEGGHDPTPLDDKSMQSLQTEHESWTAAAAAVKDAVPAQGKTLVQRMNNAINTAKKSFDEYRKKPSEAMLWQTQNAVLQFVVAERELLAGLSVS